MNVLGLQIRKKPMKRRIIAVKCYHCGKSFLVSASALRASNYCSSCE